ncbi:hypothetical protein HRR93_003670 [Exophiala dermatitidis]|nr:hypothetical protein HRR77_003492 [Exophiala dermatitidis]KAJ4677399.1 hypothetical protein HRR93_003670 [Exophiala dermatitidis]KAJ4678946.1 hypothetical protein HRR95_004204 [Exophiala dermatitidis]
MDEVVVFRSAKRRKFNRAQLQESPEPKPSIESAPAEEGDRQHGGNVDRDNEDGSEVDLPNLIRARKHLRRPVAGVQFSTTKTAARTDEEDADMAVARAEQAADKPIDISNRFVSSTGQAINMRFTDRIRVAFIDAELARRRNRTVSPSNDAQQQNTEKDSEVETPPDKPHTESTIQSASATSNVPTLSHPATVRQLTEVDLGDSAHEINLARIQAALERAKSGQPPIPEEAAAPKPRKPRIGRDGKPMKPRPRKRRNSEDLARDALVEQVLHEHKLDIYDVDDPRRPKGLNGDDAEAGDADERLAEQFRQEFMDAMAERHHRHKASGQSKTAGAAEKEPRGPKLGGSRAARAKMAQMLQQQREQQQPGQSSTKK